MQKVILNKKKLKNNLIIKSFLIFFVVIFFILLLFKYNYINISLLSNHIEFLSNKYGYVLKEVKVTGLNKISQEEINKYFQCSPCKKTQIDNPSSNPTIKPIHEHTVTKIHEKRTHIIEEEQEDSFDKTYKGEVSKSGAAILPSKRVRRMPEKIILENKKTEKLSENVENKAEISESVETETEELTADNKSK